jgi:polysaccharide biosynthesis PFTS motif protein
MKKKIIVFDDIKWYHLPLINWYRIMMRYDVYYLNPLYSSGVNRLVQGKRGVSKLKLKNPLYSGTNLSADMAFEICDDVYDKYFRTKVTEKVEELYGSDNIHLAFKKNLLIKLSEFFYYSLLFDRIQESFGDSYKNKIKIVLSKPLSLVNYLSFKSILKEKVCAGNMVFPFWLTAKSRIYNIIFKYVLCPLFVAQFNTLFMLRALINIKKHPAPVKFKFAISIISPSREFANDIRTVGFLVDNKKIKKEDVLFVPMAKIPERGRQYLKEKHFALANLSFNGDFKLLKKIFLSSLYVLMNIFKEHVLNTVSSMRLIKEFGIWNSFCRRYGIDKFITYCDFNFAHIGRNILLDKNNVNTWYYTDTVNTSDALFLKEDGNPYRHELWGFLFYDYFVSWSDRHIRFMKMHHQKIKEYLNVGCMWAEHIYEIRSNNIKSDLSGKLLANGYDSGLKTVGVFDCGYNNSTITTYEDGIAFIEGIIRLLNDFQDIYVVFKEKKPHLYFKNEPEYSRIISLLNELDAHPRCFLTGYCGNPSEVIAVSDLTINFPFTSTAIEAMSSRIKAVYYDPTDKYKGTYYDNVPKLVMHSYDELKARVQELFYRTSDNEYNDYLENYVKGDVEPFLDGSAITRFRELLVTLERK